MTAPTIGVDVGGTKLLTVVLDDGGAVVATTRHPTPRGVQPLLDGIAAAITEIATSSGLDADVRVGVGVAGLVDRRGVLRHGPNQPGIRELDVRSGLAERLGERIVVDNDANCALRVELELGAAQGASDVVLATLGTGIGGAVAVGGRIVRGANGMAGEPGHTMVDPNGPPCVCGLRGCWERYASGAGLARMARDAAEVGNLDLVVERVGGDPAAIRGEDVVEVARQGDGQAQAVLDGFAWWTAVGVANLAAVLDPEVVLLGGGLIDAADVWLDEARRQLPNVLVAAGHRTLPRLEAAHHGSGAAALGAAFLARDPT